MDARKAVRAWELRRKMTPAETLLWDRLRRSQLGGLHFRRQQVIRGFIVDFYCDAAALAVEVDGEIHATHADEDQARDRALADSGIRVLRIKNADVQQDLAGVLAQITDWAALPPLPSQGRGRG